MSNELVKAETYLPAVNGANSLAEVFAEEMDGLKFSFERVKIPSGGMTAFQVPGDDPANPDILKEIMGVIVDDHNVNAFWFDDYTGANNPPDCSSIDGKTGTVRDPVEVVACNSCPNNQWGSDPKGGKGKACKNMRRVYILPFGQVFPLLLTVPPTGMANFSDFKSKRIVGKGRRSYEVITKVALVQDKSNGGITYSKPTFAVASELPQEDKLALAEFSRQIKSFTREVAIGADDYDEAPKDSNESPM